MFQSIFGGKNGRFSLLLFVINVSLTFSILCILLAVISPSIWHRELTASFFALITTFIIVHFCNGLVEYFFHRYVLHKPVIPFLWRFFRLHQGTHHGHTNIVKTPIEKTEPLLCVISQNNFPMIKDEQFESATFPWYSFAAFALIGSIIFLPIQMVFPSIPIFLSGFSSIAFSLSLYEILHAIEHLPLETCWNRLFRIPFLGRGFLFIYRFHLHHHVDMKSNEAISGFFGFPIFDWMFGTYASSSSTYPVGQQLEMREIQNPIPYLPIRFLDRLTDWIVKRRRQHRSQFVMQ